MEKIKIGILGSGDVAKALGKGFLKKGYEVMLGTRSKDKLNDWSQNDGKGAKTGSFSETAVFGDLLVLATKGSGTNNAIELAGKDHFNGKTVIDATNPIADAPPENGVLKFYTSPEKSAMEEYQANFPKANFVKAFNSVGSPFMVDPPFSTKPTMFICGNNPEAKKQVAEILNKFGWESADFGGAESARAIEQLCILWCIPGMLTNSWNHAFKLLRM